MKGRGRKGRGEEGKEWEGDSFGPRSGPGPHTFLRIYAGMRVNKFMLEERRARAGAYTL